MLLLPHSYTVLFNAEKKLVLVREVSNSVVNRTLFQSVLASKPCLLVLQIPVTGSHCRLLFRT